MLISLVMGTVLGFLSGVGIGGGSLLLLWLTLAEGMEPQTARGVNLLFFLPAAAAACYYRKKQGSLEVKKMLPAMIAGCLGAVLGSRIGGWLDAAALRKGFGILLLFTGVRELLWKEKKDKL